MRLSAFTVGELTETTTLRRFTDLLEDGFRVHNISSTWEHVIVEMEKGHRRTVVRLDRDAARSMLDAKTTTAQRVPAGPQ